MAASYPGAVKTFTTKSDGAGNTIQAEHINSLQDEVNAIEAGLLNGTAPLTASNATVNNLTVNGTFTGGSLGNSTFGNLSVSSNSTLARLHVTGGSTHGSLVVTGGSTLGILQAGASTLTALVVSGGSTLGSLTISSAAPTTPVANTLYRDALPKAWGRITSSGEILGDFNVSSATAGAGNVYSIAFATALSDSNYCVLTDPRGAVVDASTSAKNALITLQASTGWSVQFSNDTSSGVATAFGFVVFGA